MPLDQARCALPGCEEVLLPSDDKTMQRKYCCAAHRAAARRLRHEALADLAVAHVAPEAAAAPAGAMANAAMANATRSNAAKFNGAKSHAATAATSVAPVASVAAAPPAAPAVRQAAAKVRALVQHGQRITRERMATASARSAKVGNPLHRLPDRERCRAALVAFRNRSIAAFAALRRGSVRGRERFELLSRGRRIMLGTVAGGIVVLLVWAFVAAVFIPASPTAGPSAPMALPPLGGVQQWGDQVQATESEVNAQLDKVSGAEQAWNALPADSRSGDLPQQLHDLLTLKSALQQKQTMLASASDELADLNNTAAALADAQKRASDVRNALNALPAAQNSTDYQAALRSQLTGQLDVITNQCNALEHEHAILENGVRQAMMVPLPTADASADGVVAAVMALIQQRTPPPPPAPAAVTVSAHAAAPHAVHARVSVHTRAPAPAAPAPAVNTAGSITSWAINMASSFFGHR